MQSNTLARLIALRDSIARIAQPNPNVRSLIVVKRTASGISYIPIQPNPVIENVSPRLISVLGESKIRLELDDITVRGISKAYDLDILTGAGTSYIVDGQYNAVTNQVIGGAEYERVFTNPKSNSLTYDIILRRKPLPTGRY